MTTLRQEERFDVIAYEDLSTESSWTKLGKGSFGCVWKGEYLGLEVAIKEVLASNEYDVDKYFQRECLLMSSSRHPNIVQFLGLCRAPPSTTDSTSASKGMKRTLIVSEFLPRGNLRQYIDDERLRFPWRLRLSFAVDIARALAYLHVRKCLHRDLKGENMLVTENERIKLTDFGFARIAPRNEAEIQRMSYCGTDGYMSPEILLGERFDLPSDIYSFGIILIELCCRRLASSSFLVRYPPWFTLDRDQILPYLSPGCPAAMVELAIRCTSVEPGLRPGIKDILAHLSTIEKEVIARDLATVRPDQYGTLLNVGTVSFAGTERKKKARPNAPRLPSFEGRVHVPSSRKATTQSPNATDDEDDLDALAVAPLKSSQLAVPSSTTYSTVVLKHAPSASSAESELPSLPPSWLASSSSSFQVDGSFVTTRAHVDVELAASTIKARPALATELENVTLDDLTLELALHRFSLVKPGLQRFLGLTSSPSHSNRTSLDMPTSASPGARGHAKAEKKRRFANVHEQQLEQQQPASGAGLLAALGGGIKCGVCEKRLGVLKAWLECDDCSFKCHVRCSDLAEPNCSHGH